MDQVQQNTSILSGVFEDRKKTIIVLIGVVGLAFFTSLVLVLFTNRRNDLKQTAVPFSQVQQQISPSQQSTSGSSPRVSPNPLGDEKNIESVNNAVNTSLKNNGLPIPTPVKYNFVFQLDPALLKKPQSSLFNSFIKRVFAQTICAPSNVPSTLSVYSLKTDLSAAEAEKLAEKYGVKSPPYAQPVEGGISEFYFADPKTNGNSFSIKPFGDYHYHFAIKDFTAEIDETQASALADTVVSGIGIKERLSKISAIINPSENTGRFAYTYQHYLDSRPIIDTNSINSLDARTPCEAEQATSMGAATVRLSKDGKLTDLLAHIRQIKEVKKFASIDLSHALSVSGFKSLIDPVVLSKKLVTSGKVTIDQSTDPLYFDLGPSYAQTCYLPIYFTSGKLADGTRILAIFPAVDLNQIESLCKSENATTAASNSGTFNPLDKHGTIQYSTIDFQQKLNKPPAGSQCYGNQVDYVINCLSTRSSKKSTRPGCDLFIGVPVDQAPDSDVCTTGCKSQENVIVNTTGASDQGDACERFLNQYNDKQKDGKKIPLPTGYTAPQNLPAGAYSCSMNTCPC